MHGLQLRLVNSKPVAIPRQSRARLMWRFCGALSGLFAMQVSGPAQTPGDVPGLNVKWAKFCARVDTNREPIREFDAETTVSKGPVSLWTVLSGDKETLRFLRKSGLLPIRHRWFYADVLKFEEVPPEEQLEDGQPIKVGTIKHLAKLDSEIVNTGAFDWRTWSNKRALRTGIYIVQVVFNDGSPVLDSDRNPCVLRFKYSPTDQ